MSAPPFIINKQTILHTPFNGLLGSFHDLCFTEPEEIHLRYYSKASTTMSANSDSSGFSHVCATIEFTYIDVTIKYSHEK